MRGRFALLLALVGACGPTQTIVLRDATRAVESPPPLEIVTMTAAVRDPLPISGERVAVVGLDRELRSAIAVGAAPWSARHAGGPGWQLTVELVRAEAARQNGRVVVALDVRATLRTHLGRVYLAQTQMHCRQAEVADTKGAAAVFYACTTSLGHDLGGWLAGIAL